MLDSSSVIVLNKEVRLCKEGFEDLVYETGTMVKVLMVSNDHVVVKDEKERTFILNIKEKDMVWSFL